MVPKTFKGAQKTQRMASALTFLERHRKDGDERLNHILRVTGDETCVSFINVEIKEQSNQWIHTHSSNKPKIFSQTLSACQKTAGNCFIRQERSADGAIHGTRN
jgi:hypothetical protein